MVDGMSISATSGNGQLSNFIPDMTSTQEVAVSYSAGIGGTGVRRRPDEPDSARRRKPVQGILLRHRREREVAVEQLHAGTEGRGTADAQFLKVVYDVNPGVGGPIVKDKLWFYSAARWQTTQSYIAGGT